MKQTGGGRIEMPNIMVVDDDANIRAVLKYRFEREKYSVQLATNGMDALNKVNIQKPDIIILDLMMPEMDGMQFLSLLKGDRQTNHIPVIVLTALGHTPHSERTRELGATGLIVKPFSPGYLVEEVNRALNKGNDLCVGPTYRFAGMSSQQRKENR